MPIRAPLLCLALLGAASMPPVAAQDPSGGIPEPTPHLAPAPGAAIRITTFGDPAAAAARMPLVRMLQAPDFQEILDELLEIHGERAERIIQMQQAILELDGGTWPSWLSMRPFQFGETELTRTAMELRMHGMGWEELLQTYLPRITGSMYRSEATGSLGQNLITWVFCFEFPPAIKERLRGIVFGGGRDVGQDWEQDLAAQRSRVCAGGHVARDVTPGFFAELHDHPRMWLVETDTQVALVLGNEADPLTRLQALPKAPGSPATGAGTGPGDAGGYELELDVAAFAGLALLEKALQNAGGTMAELDRALELLGVPTMRRLGLRVAFRETGIATSGWLESRDPLVGLASAWMAEPGELPVVPMEDGTGLLHAAMALDLDRVKDTMDNYATQTGDQQVLREFDSGFPARLIAAWDGTLAIGIAAPRSGQVTPRFGVSFGVRDEAAMDALLDEIRTDAGSARSFEHDGTPWTQVIIPDAPALLSPAFARLGDRVYVAEQPNTLREMLDLAKAGRLSHGITDGQSADPLARSLPGGAPNAVQLVFAPDRINRELATTWLPLLRLPLADMLDAFGHDPADLLSPDDLPPAADWDPWLGGGAGGVRVTDRRIEVGSAGPLGGPPATLFLLVLNRLGPTFVDANMATYERAQGTRLTLAQGRRIHSALEAWRRSFGDGARYPQSLGELLTTGLLQDPAVLVAPGDDAPRMIEYEDEDGTRQQVPCSYRYLAGDGVQVPRALLLAAVSGPWRDHRGRPDETRSVVMLYEARDQGRGRIVVTRDGFAVRLYRWQFRDLIGGR